MSAYRISHFLEIKEVWMKQTKGLNRGFIILYTFCECEMVPSGIWEDSCMGCSQQRDAEQNEAA